MRAGTAATLDYCIGPGRRSPWYLAFARDNHDWRPFLPEKCMGGFASDLGVTPKIEGAMQTKRNACKPKVTGPKPNRTECTSPHCFRKNAELNKDDEDKLWEAYELGQKLDEPGTVVEGASGFQERLDADLTRQINAWAPLSLNIIHGDLAEGTKGGGVTLQVRGRALLRRRWPGPRRQREPRPVEARAAGRRRPHSRNHWSSSPLLYLLQGRGLRGVICARGRARHDG